LANGTATPAPPPSLTLPRKGEGSGWRRASSPLSRRAVLAGAAALFLAGRGAARAAVPSRIVCAGSDVTETVVALAGIEAVKGVDTTSQTPAAVRALPSIGYLRQISVEGVLSLRPDLLISNRDLGPQPAVEQLRGTGLRVELVEGDLDGEGIAAKVRRIGALIGRQAEAEALAQTVSRKMTALAERLKGVATRPTIVFVRSADGGVLLAAGKLDLVNAAFALAGGVNPLDFPGFKPVSREVLAASPPDFIVTGADVIAKAGGAQAFLQAGGLEQAFAGKPDRLAAVDMTTLFSFGPSTADEIERLARRIHPERFAP